MHEVRKTGSADASLQWRHHPRPLCQHFSGEESISREEDDDSEQFAISRSAPVERLERARVLKCLGDPKRARVYCATALLDILENWPALSHLPIGRSERKETA